MSTILITRSGDTWEDLARRAYGSTDDARLIRKANPGLREPFREGTRVRVPKPPRNPVFAQSQVDSADSAEVALVIDGTRFRFWTEVSITRKIDNIHSVEFGAPFFPEDENHRRVFRPFSYKPVQIFVGGEVFFFFFFFNVVPELSINERTVVVSCYGTPGVLEDCTPSEAMLPLEYEGLKLSQIAGDLTEPFGLNVVVDGDEGPAFDRAAIEAQEQILRFLSELAKQRGFVVACTDEGDLLLRRPEDAGEPVAVLEEGLPPLGTSIEVDFDGQQFYSEVTGIVPSSTEDDGASYTVRNPFLPDTLRPHVFSIGDTEESGIAQATESKTGRMFGSMIRYIVQLPTWRDQSGNLWRENTKIRVKAPGVMIYDFYDFLIDQVTFERSGDEERATLEITVPEAYTEQIPERLPWD